DAKKGKGVESREGISVGELKAEGSRGIEGKSEQKRQISIHLPSLTQQELDDFNYLFYDKKYWKGKRLKDEFFFYFCQSKKKGGEKVLASMENAIAKKKKRIQERNKISQAESIQEFFMLYREGAFAG
ncbi:hypothetical protein Dimus_015580, partial [Dionaea muscipula]